MAISETETFLEDWQEDPRGVKPVFHRLALELKAKGAELELVIRPGVTASLRAKLPEQTKRLFFCLVDVVEDVEGRWLSVCFYAEAVTDPDELGNPVPLGLLGEDGYCFDLEEPDAVLENYPGPRMDESIAFARNQG